MSQSLFFQNARRCLSALVRAGLYFIAGSIVLTLLLRFIPPVTSGLMMERRAASLFSSEPYQRHYNWVPLKSIAPVMGVAVVAAEDQLFAEHFGFDWKAIEKAISYNQKQRLKKHGKTRGASTISQQTAKNLFLWDGRNWLRKGLETYFTVLIECLWSKERILETYLNIVEFGDGVYGVDAAAQVFFHKPAARLSASEAALLAAVLPNPHVYQVEKPSSYIRGRQQWILANMRRLGGAAYIDKLQ
jgi:monofunctional biosynthetic peptidoglycan transglycosylase